MSEPVLSINNLTKNFGNLVAVDRVSLSVYPKEIFALLGPNGAGKTTLIGCITGLVRPTSGTGKIHGYDMLKEPEKTKPLIGLVPQELNYDPYFTVYNELKYKMALFGVRPTRKRVMEILDIMSLTDKAHTNTRRLSGGMKRRLLIAKALAHRPRLLFLDEPTAGVDVELRQELWKYVRLLKDQGTTIILTTHYLEEAEALADRVGIMNHGQLLQVEKVSSLIRKFGTRSLRIKINSSLDSVPEALSALGCSIGSDQQEICYPVSPQTEEIQPVLDILNALGLKVLDISDHRSSLEDVFRYLIGNTQDDESSSRAELEND